MSWNNIEEIVMYCYEKNDVTEDDHKKDLGVSRREKYRIKIHKIPPINQNI
jgi:hypothetical protein